MEFLCPIPREEKSSDWTHYYLLRVAVLSGGGRRLRVIIEKLLDKAEQGDLQAIKEVFDRLDGKPVQAIERGDIPIEAMTDQQLMAIIRGGSCEPRNEPVLICAGLFRQPTSGGTAHHLGTDLGIDGLLVENSAFTSMPYTRSLSEIYSAACCATVGAVPATVARRMSRGCDWS